MLTDHIDSEGEEHLTTIREHAESTVDLTASARDLTEILLRSDRSVETVSLAPVSDLQIETTRSTYLNAELTVEESPPEVEIQTRELLSSIFRNLRKNAVQHNDTETPEITVAVDTEPDRVTVQIADNGPGMRDEIKQESYGKSEKGVESAGTGIGLYLVRTLVVAYGGEVWVEDSEPDGAVFVVELQPTDRLSD